MISVIEGKGVEELDLLAIGILSVISFSFVFQLGIWAFEVQQFSCRGGSVAADAVMSIEGQDEKVDNLVNQGFKIKFHNPFGNFLCKGAVTEAGHPLSAMERSELCLLEVAA